MLDLRDGRSQRERLSDDVWGPPNTSTPSPTVLPVRSFRDVPRRLPFLDGNLVISCEGPMPAWLPAVVARLDELANLPPNWNSYRAADVRQSCLLAAVELLVAIMRDNSPTPAVVPTNRGTVLLEWHKRGIDLEIDVLGPDRLHVVAEDASSGIEWESDVGADLTKIVRFIERLS